MSGSVVSKRSMRSAAFVIAATALFPTGASAQFTCPGGGIYTETSCGEDVCSCASPCVTKDDCNSGCCLPTFDDGGVYKGNFCSPGCACDGGAPEPGIQVVPNCAAPQEVAPSCSSTAAGPLFVGAAAAAALALRARRYLH